jgi:hypothetical protein
VKTGIKEKVQKVTGRKIYNGRGLINKFLILLPPTSARIGKAVLCPFMFWISKYYYYPRIIATEAY